MQLAFGLSCALEVVCEARREPRQTLGELRIVPARACRGAGAVAANRLEAARLERFRRLVLEALEQSSIFDVLDVDERIRVGYGVLVDLLSERDEPGSKSQKASSPQPPWMMYAAAHSL